MFNVCAITTLAEVHKTARLKLNQNSQQIEPNYSTLSYNMYPTKDTEQLVLFPDKTCRDTGFAVVKVNVTFDDCPVGFMLSGDQCSCDNRLQKFTNQCIVGDHNHYITREFDSRFWIGYLTRSTLGIGLILYRSCPPDYCKTYDINISFTDLDNQCAFNHSGLLCGSCGNYSLILGDSRCRECSNIFLLLLVAFIVAGIFLVAFLSILRLTVATGMINSIILYANIVQANKLLFFSNENNVLTVFIAWMNLDLGIPTCFYNGMDAYAQTWLQFAFPLYVWFLILLSLIIITSRYSTLMTKLIGSNPIAVLATPLLVIHKDIDRNLSFCAFGVSTYKSHCLVQRCNSSLLGVSTSGASSFELHIYCSLLFTLHISPPFGLQNVWFFWNSVLSPTDNESETSFGLVLCTSWISY